VFEVTGPFPDVIQQLWAHTAATCELWIMVESEPTT
jgi:hypothetical protein